MLDYQDASESPDDRVDYPQFVEGFEQLDFELVGRVVAIPTVGTLDDIAAGYGDRASDFLEHATVPMPILRAPDRSAFVDVSWFWDSPSVRLRSTLADGSLVETLRRWEAPPPAGEMSQFWETIDIDEAMSEQHNPAGGRSIEVVTGCTPAEQWRHHRDHVARYSAARNAVAVEHSDLAGGIAQLRSTFEHSVEVARAYAGLWRPLVYGYAGIGFLLITALVVWAFVTSSRGGDGEPFFLGAIAVALLFAGTMTSVVRLVISRVRSSPVRLRPRLVAERTEPD